MSEVRHRYKIHSRSVVDGCSRGNPGNTTKFYDNFEDAMERCRRIVAKDPACEMVIFQATHVVRSAAPPVEVIDLNDES